MYIVRLDDASEYMDVAKWNIIQHILEGYSINPIVGIIPHNCDPRLTGLYSYNSSFWDKAQGWREMGWRIALHGYNHVFRSLSGGVNPVNAKSEFSGLPLDEQKAKIDAGFQILLNYDLHPDVFFAPAHTFDNNTLVALRELTDIRIVNDTISNDVYFYDGFYYIPQQTGKPRQLPFALVTICIHPNSMTDENFDELNGFIYSNRDQFIDANRIELKKRKLSLYDKALRSLYFQKRKIVL